MRQVIKVSAVVLAVAFLAACGARQRGPAQEAIKAADAAWAPVAAEAMRYVPDQAKGIEDAIAAAKVLADFAKANDQRPAVKGGIYEGAVVDQAMVSKLATMPTRDEALSMFAGYLNSILMSFALALDARRTQLEGSNEIPQASA